MKPAFWFAILAFVPPSIAEDTDRKLTDRSKRGTLANRFEKVRGDSGKWRDESRLQVSVSPPAPEGKFQRSLDSWADTLDIKKRKLTSDTDTWLIFRTAQLDDNDRLWIEKIERKGSRITVLLNHAVWQGHYSKNFTWYGTWGVNLGKLPPGQYEAIWSVKPLVFQRFEDPKNRRTSWPGDEKAAGDDVPVENRTTSFTVSA